MSTHTLHNRTRRAALGMTAPRHDDTWVTNNELRRCFSPKRTFGIRKTQTENIRDEKKKNSEIINRLHCIICMYTLRKLRRTHSEIDVEKCKVRERRRRNRSVEKISPYLFI